MTWEVGAILPRWNAACLPASRFRYAPVFQSPVDMSSLLLLAAWAGLAAGFGFAANRAVTNADR